MYTDFPKGVYFVKGVRNSAICDLRDGRVYSLNSVATKQIESSEIGPELRRFLTQLNLISQSKEGDNKLGCLDSKKSFAWFEITTSKCNLMCQHCYLGEVNIVRNSSNRISYTKWLKVIDETYDIGVRKCQFIGGEPFLYSEEGKGVLDLCEYAIKKGFQEIEIFTNCQLMNLETANRIKDFGINIATSIYSVSSEVHDIITRKTGSQVRTVEAIKTLLDLGVKIRAETVLMSLNQDTVLDTISFLKELGVKHRSPDPIRPTGRGSDGTLVPSNEYLMKYGYYVQPNFSACEERFFFNKEYNSCLAKKFVVTESGDVFPCVFARNITYGNVHNNSLAEILQSEQAKRVERLSKDKILVCRDCEYRYVCSDCRPISADTYKTKEAFYNYPDPRCTYNPYTGVWGEGRWVLKGSELHYELFS